MIRFGNRKEEGSLFSMSESNLKRKWVREEVVILVTEYFRTKSLSFREISETQQMISDFLRKREEILTGEPVSEIFRDYAGIRMQFGRIRCLDPDTHYFGMKGTKLQKKVVQEYLVNPQKLIAKAEQIYAKYEENN